MKTFPETVLSDFRSVNCCTKCNWFYNPDEYNAFHHFTVCPKCGNDCERAVGRLVYMETKRWFGCISSKCVGMLKGKRKVIKINSVNMIIYDHG